MVEGTRMHKKIEKYYEEGWHEKRIRESYRDRHEILSDTSKEFIQFLAFAKYADQTLDLAPYRAEWKTCVL
jgi:uncharacterized protein YktA (UPF0223 family)